MACKRSVFTHLRGPGGGSLRYRHPTKSLRDCRRDPAVVAKVAAIRLLRLAIHPWIGAATPITSFKATTSLFDKPGRSAY